MNTAVMCSSLFLEGLLSFFSPCVLPLVPLYLSYLTRDARREDGTYDRRRTLVLTVSFVLGICTVFFLAGLSSSALHVFFTAHTYAFELAGGILLVFLGLMGLHVVEVPLLNRTWMKQMDVKAPMSFVRAALLGFLFSFA
ncbi:MAG: cytochrome C biogenesis protein, partial [Solobacterium sp.]|nr:cytochrome C biogenesis protein [Solobacterium sp.]